MNDDEIKKILKKSVGQLEAKLNEYKNTFYERNGFKSNISKIYDGIDNEAFRVNTNRNITNIKKLVDNGNFKNLSSFEYYKLIIGLWRNDDSILNYTESVEDIKTVINFLKYINGDNDDNNDGMRKLCLKIYFISFIVFTVSKISVLFYEYVNYTGSGLEPNKSVDKPKIIPTYDFLIKQNIILICIRIIDRVKLLSSSVSLINSNYDELKDLCVNIKGIYKNAVNLVPDDYNNSLNRLNEILNISNESRMNVVSDPNILVTKIFNNYQSLYEFKRNEEKFFNKLFAAIKNTSVKKNINLDELLKDPLGNKDDNANANANANVDANVDADADAGVLKLPCINRDKNGLLENMVFDIFDTTKNYYGYSNFDIKNFFEPFYNSGRDLIDIFNTIDENEKKSVDNLNGLFKLYVKQTRKDMLKFFPKFRNISKDNTSSSSPSLLLSYLGNMASRFGVSNYMNRNEYMVDDDGNEYMVDEDGNEYMVDEYGNEYTVSKNNLDLINLLKDDDLTPGVKERSIEIEVINNDGKLNDSLLKQTDVVYTIEPDNGGYKIEKTKILENDESTEPLDEENMSSEINNDNKSTESLDEENASSNNIDGLTEPLEEENIFRDNNINDESSELLDEEKIFSDSNNDESSELLDEEKIFSDSNINDESSELLDEEKIFSDSNNNKSADS